MRSTALAEFCAAEPALALVRVAEALGSTPREAGAWMLVSPASSFGTIGGGQLEFMAIAEARQMLRGARANPETARLSIPLGPEIGQCCGGRVELELVLLDDAMRADILAGDARERATRPHVYLFGGGHVGRALSEALALLPVAVMVIETRADALGDFPPTVSTRLTAVPEDEVRAAPPGSAFVVLTHDHALDFLIVAEALARRDAAYIGMIGSATKKSTFRSWYLRTAGGTAADADRVVTPIGGATVRDKRPAVIAALAAAEIATALYRD
jgi:xanthine dehydrogenase accessory factor